MSDRIQGYKKLEVYVYEDGSKHDIRINTTSGEFLAIVENERLKADTLEEIRKLLFDKLKETRALQWKPVIVLSKYDRWGNRGDLPFRWERVFQAVMPDGSTKFACYQVKHEFGNNTPEYKKHDGIPGSHTHVWGADDRVIIEYDGEKWEALEVLKRKFNELENKIRDIVFDAEQRNKFLSHVLKSEQNLLAYKGEDKSA